MVLRGSTIPGMYWQSALVSTHRERERERGQHTHKVDIHVLVVVVVVVVAKEVVVV